MSCEIEPITPALHADQAIHGAVPPVKKPALQRIDLERLLSDDEQNEGGPAGTTFRYTHPHIGAVRLAQCHLQVPQQSFPMRKSMGMFTERAECHEQAAQAQ